MGFTNFYRRFAKKYAKVTAPISDLLKKEASGKWEWTQHAEIALQKLKRAFTEAPILQHFDPEKPITLQTDASGFVPSKVKTPALTAHSSEVVSVTCFSPIRANLRCISIAS
jgi:hypothetical protein